MIIDSSVIPSGPNTLYAEAVSIGRHVNVPKLLRLQYIVASGATPLNLTTGKSKLNSEML